MGILVQSIEITSRRTVNKQIVKLICKPIKKLFRKDYDGEQKKKINPERGGEGGEGRGFGPRERVEEKRFSSGNSRATATLARSYQPVDNAVVITRRLQRRVEEDRE